MIYQTERRLSKAWLDVMRRRSLKEEVFPAYQPQMVAYLLNYYEFRSKTFGLHLFETSLSLN